MAFSSPTGKASLPYLKGASSGGLVNQVVKRSSGKTAMSDSELRDYRISGRVDDSISTGSNLRYSNVTNAIRPNGNVISMKGKATITTQDGKTIEAPNALVQQLMNQERVNSGRYSGGEMFDPNKDQLDQISGDRVYKDYGVTQGQFDNFMKNNPQYSGSGYVNPYMEKVTRLQQIDEQINNLNNQLYNSPRREVVGSDGKVVSSDDSYVSKLASLNKDRLMAPSVARGDRVRAAEGDTQIQDLLRKKYIPTVSNVPIKETVI